MNRKNIVRIKTLLVACLLAVVCSCSEDNRHLQAIPSSCSMLMSVDVSQVSGVGSKGLLKALLHATNADQCGLALAEKIYLFETADGNLGLCLAVEDYDRLQQFMDEQARKGTCGRIEKRRDCHLAMVDNTWAVGFSEHALLAIGPVTAQEQTEAFSRLTRYLGQHEERSILPTRLFAKLDSIEAPMAMVAQAQALPEQLVAPFLLGAPADADPSQIYVAAALEKRENLLLMEGETLSFNASIDKKLKEASTHFRPITQQYVSQIAQDCVYGLFLNVEGGRLVDMLHGNKSLQALLTGLNTAIDMDKVLRSVDGDMAMVMPTMGEHPSFAMRAQVKDQQFLSDVDYWKQSAPRGATIENHGTTEWLYKSGDTQFLFGTRSGEFFMEPRNLEPSAGSEGKGQPSRSLPLDAFSSHSRMCMVLNLSAFLSMSDVKAGNATEVLTRMFTPVFGSVQTIVYNMK